MILQRSRLFLLTLGAAVAVIGCTGKPHSGPTVNAFHGQLTHNGNPVSFPEGQKASLRLITPKGESFGIPIKPDGSFKIGWMPIESYTAILETENTSEPGMNQGAPKTVFTLPEKVEIVQGKMEYTIDLGPSWKPADTSKKEEPK